jgi:hypothetical protein
MKLRDRPASGSIASRSTISGKFSGFRGAKRLGASSKSFIVACRTPKRPLTVVGLVLVPRAWAREKGRPGHRRTAVDVTACAA